MGKENDSLDIDEKIELLSSAYEKLCVIKEDLSEVAGKIYNISDKYSDGWKGMNADQVYNCCSVQGELGGILFSLEDSVDTIYQEVSKKMESYSNERYENKFFTE